MTDILKLITLTIQDRAKEKVTKKVNQIPEEELGDMSRSALINFHTHHLVIRTLNRINDLVPIVVDDIVVML